MTAPTAGDLMRTMAEQLTAAVIDDRTSLADLQAGPLGEVASTTQVEQLADDREGLERLIQSLERAAGVADALAISGLTRFDYVNWHGDPHHYVVNFSAGQAPGPTLHEGRLCLVGQLVSRDGDPRPEMGATRRRPFVAELMENVEAVA